MAFYCLECGCPLDDIGDLCYDCENVGLCVECGAPTSPGEEFCDSCQDFLDNDDEELDEILDEDDEQFLHGI